MFTETKVFQALYENVRDQVKAVEIDEEKMDMGFKARFEQQKAGYEMFYYKNKSMLAYEHKFISWLLLYYTYHVFKQLSFK